MSEPSVQLAPSQEWFRVLAEATSTAIVVIRERLLYVNPACEVLTGYSHEELMALGDPGELNQLRVSSMLLRLACTSPSVSKMTNAHVG